MRLINLNAFAAGFIVACLLGFGCKSHDINWVDDGGAPTSSKVVDPRSTRGHMRDHFNRSAALLSAVVDGDLEQARVESDWLANHELQPSLYPWKIHVEKLRVAARSGATAGNIHSAARAVANIGDACASCHKLSGSVAKFPRVAMPAATQSMQLHAWAAERMWEGLVAPSEELWNQGVDVLSVAPLRGSASPAPDIATQERTIHALANEGRRARTPSERVEVFARYLENCNRCHRSRSGQP